MKNIYYRLIGLGSDFDRIFFANEYKALSGRKGSTILSLLGILFLTFVSIGFAVGGIDNLEREMANPYTNWVELKISDNRTSGKAKKLLQEFNKPDVMDRFLLDRSNGFCEFVLHIYKSDFRLGTTYKDTLNKTVWGRTIEADESLLLKILEADNVEWKSADFDPVNDALGFDEVVVTSELVRQLGYGKIDSSFGHLLVYIDTSLVCLKVRAVVTRLPGVSGFISSPGLYNIATAKTDARCYCGELLKVDDYNSYNFSFLLGKEGDYSALFDKLSRDYFRENNVEVADIDNIRIGGRDFVIKKLYFQATEKPDSMSLDSFKYLIDGQFETAPFTRVATDSRCCRSINFSDYHNLAFNFRKLDSVRVFERVLRDSFDVEIDMNQVEEKENFAVVSNLTLFISLVLLFLGISSIVLFVTNLLKSHLGSIRSNLGTLQAFGLSNRNIRIIYLKIIFTFLMQSVLVTCLLSWGVELADGYWRRENSLFSFTNKWVLFSIAGLVFFGMWFSYTVINRLMNDTPGNMIYER